MTNLLSSISGHFSKSLVLGAFFPALLFVFLFMNLVVPLLPPDLWPLKWLEAQDTQWKIISISAVTVVLTVLISNLNISIIRFYEGYLWENSLIGKWRTQSYQRKFRSLQARWAGMRTLVYAMEKADPDDQRLSKLYKEWIEVGLAVNNSFPADESSVLPTGLGNVIRSFEDYTNRQYGIDAITLWPRLIAKIDKDYAAAIDDAKTSFDFMLNTSALSAAMSLSILAAGLLYPTPFAASKFLLPWLVEIVTFAVLASLFYKWSIGRASAWGGVVKGAFDLYRWDLLKQLGYNRVPATRFEERQLWDDISLQMIFGDSPRLRVPDYSGKRTNVICEPHTVELKITRGISMPDANGTTTVTLEVMNAGTIDRDAENIIITETMPDGFDYEWGSASAGDSRSVTVVGTNPYRFHIGTLAKGAKAELTYRMMQYIKPAAETDSKQAITNGGPVKVKSPGG